MQGNNRRTLRATVLVGATLMGGASLPAVTASARPASASLHNRTEAAAHTLAPAAARARAARAEVRRLSVSVAGSKVIVRGAVALSPDSAAARRRVRVVVRLNGIDHAWERHLVPLAGDDSFAVHWTTRLTGRLTLTARATIAGAATGPLLRRSVVVSPTATTSTTPTPAPSPTTTGTPLLGLFKLAPGAAPLHGTPSGSYVEMLTGSGGALPNPTSPAQNKSYTTFTPGAIGGLSTVAYEPAPAHAFAHGSSGGALADDIIAPVPFEGTNFSVDTNATDPQTGQADPIPQIDDNHGVLSGQITAWVAQWNGQSFNQGTPKPDGTSPAPTTALTGTYDATTGAFTLTWRSRIVGGPFNGYSGLWHLAGTFVPASP